MGYTIMKCSTNASTSSRSFWKWKGQEGKCRSNKWIFSKIVPQGFESPQQENVSRWLHNRIDQTWPQAILVAMNWEVIPYEDAISIEHENITFVWLMVMLNYFQRIQNVWLYVTHDDEEHEQDLEVQVLNT